jgi:hypothetical protein
VPPRQSRRRANWLLRLAFSYYPTTDGKEGSLRCCSSPHSLTSVGMIPEQHISITYTLCNGIYVQIVVGMTSAWTSRLRAQVFRIPRLGDRLHNGPPPLHASGEVGRLSHVAIYGGVH